MLIEHVYSSGATRQFPINIPLISSALTIPTWLLPVTRTIVLLRGDQRYFPVRTGGVSKLFRQFANSFVLIAQVIIAPRT